jgi:hypothetical protein
MNLQRLLDPATTPFDHDILPGTDDYVSIFTNADGHTLIFIATPGTPNARAIHTLAPSASIPVVGGFVRVIVPQAPEREFIAACWNASRALRNGSDANAAMDEPRVLVELTPVTAYRRCQHCRIRIGCTLDGTWYHLDADEKLCERSCRSASMRINDALASDLRTSWVATPSIR